MSHEMTHQFLLPGGTWQELFTTYPTLLVHVQGKQHSRLPGDPSLLQHKHPLSVQATPCLPIYKSTHSSQIVNEICVVLQLPQWKMSSDSQATLVTGQHYVWGWQWRSIRVHNPAVPLDWVLAATTMTTVWTTVRLFSCMGQEVAL